MSDLISRQAILKHIEKTRQGLQMMDDTHRASIIMNGMYLCEKAVRNQPPAQPQIIRCKDCKCWTQSTGKMKGYGLGRCDFHDADLVSCNGFCYWAERRTDG